MKASRAFAALAITALVLLGIARATTLHSQDPAGADLIVIDLADTVRAIDPEQSSGLTPLLNAAAPRVVVDFANHVQNLVIAAPASSLDSLLSALPPRIVLQAANHRREIVTQDVVEDLGQLLASVPARVRVAYANHARHLDALFPKEMVDDRTAPTITHFTSDGTRIFWTSNEFTTSSVQIGLRSGSYSQTFTDALFRTSHELALPREVTEAVSAAEAAGVPNAADTTYFLRIASTDLSGNQSTSQEYSAIQSNFIYLPNIGR